MEYQGIITGIGDKTKNINVIYPEFDALLNNFIIGKNTILEGMDLQGKILTKGTCILCGYRGTINENITLDTTAYVYAKFNLHFDSDIADAFEIETSTSRITSGNTDPTEITQAGIYYLTLYINGNIHSALDITPYPIIAQYSDQTKDVSVLGVLEDGVTATTQEVNDNSNKVATTAYVHNQIQKEIDYATMSIDLITNYWEYSSLYPQYKVGTLTLFKKANYCIGKVEVETNLPLAPVVSDSLYTIKGASSLSGTKFIPAKNVVFNFVIRSTALQGACKVCVMKITNEGNIVEDFGIYVNNDTSWAECYLGYECQ